MSKVAGLSCKKSRRLLESLRNQQRHFLGSGFESANILLSPKYHLRDKDLRKIHKAARVGDAIRVRKLLLGKHGVNDRDKKKRTALHIACAYGHPKVVMTLIAGKCDVNAIDSDRCTGLMKAVQCQEEECATLLLEYGADPDIVDVRGNSALHYAVYYKNTSLAAKLLDHEVNIEATNKSGFTPFLLAVSENKLKIAKFLLMKNANMHAVDNQRRTALMHAVSHDSANLVRFVLQEGVDLFLKDAFGLTAIDYAADFKYHTNMEILLEYKEKRCEESERVNPVEEGSEDDSPRRKNQQSQELENMKKEEVTEPETEREQAEPVGGVTSVGEPRSLDGRGDDQPQEGVTEPTTGKEEQDVTCMVATGKEDDDESSWDSESVSDNLPLIRIGVDGLLQVNGQAVENPEMYLHWLPNRKREDSAPSQMREDKDVQALTSEPGLALTSEEQHKVLARNEDNQCQVGEERKQEWDEWEASESLHAAALDHEDAGSPRTRKNRKAGALQSASTDSKEQDGGSALSIKEGKKRGHEIWSSGDFVTELTSEESKSVAGDILAVKDPWSLNDRDPDKGRTAERKSEEKHQVLEMSAMEDTDDLTQPAELSSEDEADPCSNRQQTETKSEHCELLTRKNGLVENSVSEEEVTKTEPVGSRVALKQKEKRENERVKTQLPAKDEFYTEDMENQQCDMALRILHMKVKQTLKQLQEAQERRGEVARHFQRMQDRLQKLQAECSDAEVTIQMQGEKIAELQKLHEGLTRDKEEQLKRLNKTIPSLECSLDQKKNKTEALEQELTEIKKHMGIMRNKLNDHENGEFSCHGDLKTKEFEMNISVNVFKNEIHELKEKWGTIMSKYLPLNVQFKYMEQELLAIKIAQKQYEKLHKDQKALERDALDLQHQLQENRAKLEDKKRAMALRDSNNDSVMSQMELRIENLKSELKKMEAEEESNTRKIEQYKQCCVREQELSKILSHKLDKTNRKLSKVRTDILLMTEWNRNVQNSHLSKPAQQSPSRNSKPPISGPQPSPEPIQKSLFKKQQKMVKDITEEVDKAAAELESWTLKAYPSRSK
ncbi:ankyrin repeat domain-containing protein 26-like [Meriones unguiculatus]|uniref:ankyrin repeat domain-containing protein 26-like n=1 Tax=Meriones unguiculatus TaxID=10047 RepID=UPI00293F0E90|nr:ankyrin repeat domain-containing protein 26-like [Meriones unguiculatus]